MCILFDLKLCWIIFSWLSIWSYLVLWVGQALLGLWLGYVRSAAENLTYLYKKSFCRASQTDKHKGRICEYQCECIYKLFPNRQGSPAGSCQINILVGVIRIVVLLAERPRLVAVGPKAGPSGWKTGSTHLRSKMIIRSDQTRNIHYGLELLFVVNINNGDLLKDNILFS